MSFEIMPSEVVCNIFSFIEDDCDVAQLGRRCRRFRSIAMNEIGERSILKALQNINKNFLTCRTMREALIRFPQIIKRIVRLELKNTQNMPMRLPTNIDKFSQLQSLCLNNCKLLSIPSEIGNCEQLRHIDISNNYLKTLPGELFLISSLTSIIANSNRLVSISPLIGQLKKLEVLHLQDNRIRSLPQEIEKCRLLEERWLEGNPLTAHHVQSENQSPNKRKR